MEAKVATDGLKIATVAANFAFTALASLLISGAIKAWQAHKNALEEAAKEAKEAAAEVQKTKESFNELEEKYTTLAKNGKLNWDTSSYEEARSIQKEITDLLGNQNGEMNTLLGKLDLANGKYKEQKELLLEIAYENAKQNTTDLSANMTSAKNNLEKNTFGFWTKMFGTRGNNTGFSMYNDLDKSIADYLENTLHFGNTYGENGNMYTIGKIDWSNADELVELYNKLNPAIEKLIDKYKDENYQESKIYQNLIALRSALKDNVTEYQSALEAYNKNEAFKEMAESIKKLNKAGKSIDSQEAFDSLKKSLIRSKDKLTDYDKALLEVLNETFPQFSGEAQNAANSIDSLSASIEEVNKSIDTLQSNYSTLNSAVQEYNKYGGLSLDTLQSLSTMDYEYIACLEKTGNGLTLNMTKFQELAKARLLDAEAAAIDKAITELNNVAAEDEIDLAATGSQALVEKSKILQFVAGTYTNLGNCAVFATKAQALADAVAPAMQKNATKTKQILSGLDTFLGMTAAEFNRIDGSAQGAANALGGFSDSAKDASSAANKLKDSLDKQKEGSWHGFQWRRIS